MAGEILLLKRMLCIIGFCFHAFNCLIMRQDWGYSHLNLDYLGITCNLNVTFFRKFGENMETCFDEVKIKAFIKEAVIDFTWQNFNNLQSFYTCYTSKPFVDA